MRLEDSLQKIKIIDFGSQFTQLIARKIRELGIYCEIISHNKINKKNKLEQIQFSFFDEFYKNYNNLTFVTDSIIKPIYISNNQLLN